ncbi:unnamed protein product [Trifolium pratense]|uniref:Uncharacterized protein n=1 Tax=Trifolium pratense TaxID=57577 RepID=A0ACB0K6R1_TRIPR|nr:unnamed protein product [Trifolium pratense]
MSSVETLTAPHFLWGSPNLSSAQTKSSAWQRPSMGHHLSTSNGTSHVFPNSSQSNSFVSSSQQHHHHVGSSPSGLPFERHFGFFPKSSETSLMNNVGYSGVSLGNNEGNYMLNAAFLDYRSQITAIDEYHKGTYDFLYIPIDFKNKCNAMSVMLSPSLLLPFFREIQWEKVGEV